MSLATRPDHLTIEELERRVHQVEPAAVLIPPRILRRVIKIHNGMGGLGLNVPHHKSYIIDRFTLLKITSLGELHLATTDQLAEMVVLLPRPVPGELLARDSRQILLRYWRLLFHTRVHRVFARLRAEGELPDATIQQRINAIGLVAFEEARAVLQQENYLVHLDSAATYEEYATVFLDLQFFDPRHLPHFFPASHPIETVSQILAQDVNPEPLFHETRLEGAPEPTALAAPSPPLVEELSAVELETAPPGTLRSRADEVSRRGNHVRAVILRLQAARNAPASQAGSLRGPAKEEIAKLVSRLQKSIHFPETDVADSMVCLWQVAERAAQGVWNVEMRLLYELQKVCLDNEREVYAVDLVEYCLSRFRQPIKRPLPNLPSVLTVKHLRLALSRLPAIRIADEQRARLAGLLAGWLARAEEHLRSLFRPKLLAALDKVGLVPTGVAETLARNKLVEELLDGMVQRGYLTIGDLRDALARNRLKLPDLSGPVELLSGDQLLQLNRELPITLDGVYHRGEVYLRGLQRFSALFFGNPIGRVLTLYLILPLLGSLFILKGIDGLAEEVHKYIIKPLTGSEQGGMPHVFNGWTFAILALFLLPLFHVPPFRRLVVRGLWYLWQAIRAVLYDLPRAFLRLPPVKRILQSRAYLFFYQFVGKPAVFTLPIFIILYLMSVSWLTTLGISLGFCILVSVVLNTSLGLLVEETTGDWLMRTWLLVREDLVPGVFRWIMWVSRLIIEHVEKLRYTVEEWLLFRQGQSQIVLVLKVILRVPWFVLSYMVRFGIVVLLEPQVNPIKHFPVVTVSHKLILLLAGPMAELLAPQLGWTEKETLPLVILVLGLIPGVFGFLAWELKENWKLYRANQPTTLIPVMVGSHGEHIINYIRPGFHSGTLPRLFARLRRAKGKKERKTEEALHHVEQELHRFVERELIVPLLTSKHWPAAAPVEVAHLALATNQIRIGLECPALSPTSCWVEFTNRGGRLVAEVAQQGWVGSLTEQQRDVFVTVLTGFYKLAGVDLVGEQDMALLPVAWDAWVERWQNDAVGQPHQPPLLAGVRMLGSTRA